MLSGTLFAFFSDPRGFNNEAQEIYCHSKLRFMSVKVTPSILLRRPSAFSPFSLLQLEL